MLEIPESFTVAKQLDSTLKGKRISLVTPNAQPHSFAFFSGDPNSYSMLVSGKKVQGAAAHGGQVEITAEEMRLAFSDGINIRYYSKAEDAPKKHQLMIGFEDGSVIVCTVQMYGFLSCFVAGQNQNPYYLTALEKPSPLTAAFDENYFDNLMESSKPTLSVKAFLATEQRIPGLGNGVLQDILFYAGLNPRKKLSTLTDEEKTALFHSVKTTLADMTAMGGRDS